MLYGLLKVDRPCRCVVEVLRIICDMNGFVSADELRFTDFVDLNAVLCELERLEEGLGRSHFEHLARVGLDPYLHSLTNILNLRYNLDNLVFFLTYNLSSENELSNLPLEIEN